MKDAEIVEKAADRIVALHEWKRHDENGRQAFPGPTALEVLEAEVDDERRVGRLARRALARAEERLREEVGS